MTPAVAGRRRWYAGGAVAVLAVAAALVVLTTGGSDDSNTSRGRVSTDGAASASSFQRLDGTTGSFDQYRGKPLVVNFFASWCTPCLHELPGFERVHQDLHGQVAFLGVNLQDSQQAGMQLIEETGITFDVARDPTGSLFQSLGGVAMPTTVLIDADGRVVERHSGEISAGALRQRIDTILLS